MTDRQECDLLIVGGGTAGMTCAIAAGENDVKVVVLEKTDDIGGTLHLSSGQLSGAGTRRQRALGIEDSPDQHFDDVMRLSRNTADPLIVRMAVEEAPVTIDWLEKLGFEFSPETPAIYYGHEPYSIPRSYWGPDGGRSILKVLRPLFDEHVATGNVRVLFEHRATSLLQEDGRVVGVQAVGPTGRVEIGARFTILTTGGYGANSGFFTNHTPQVERLVSACRPSSTGDGIIMALDVGARMRGTEHYRVASSGFEPDPGSGSAGEPPRFVALNPLRWPPRAIHVNQLGMRFLAEDDASPARRERALLAQPGQRIWVVFDDASLADGRSFDARLSADQVRQLADYNKICFKAPDIGSLARKAGIDPDGLADTVREWNAAVVDGHDNLGVRQPDPLIATPPFYAFLIHAVVSITFGGLAVNDNLCVLDEQGRPIPGLYAAGEALGAAATSGDAFCSGMLATPALGFGRILGRKLSRAIKDVPARVAG